MVAADVRLTAGKVLLDQSMLAGESVPHRSRVTPVSWSCRFVAGSDRAGNCGTGSAFIPQIALLIAAVTSDRRALASGRNLEVIPVRLGVSSWKVSRQRLRQASCGSLPISRLSTRQRHCRLVKPGRRRRPHLVKWSCNVDAFFRIIGNFADVADPMASFENRRSS